MLRGSPAARQANADVRQRSQAPRPPRPSLIARASGSPDPHREHDRSEAVCGPARDAARSPLTTGAARRRLVLSAAAASALPVLAAAAAAAAPAGGAPPGPGPRPEDAGGAATFATTSSGARLQVVDRGARGDAVHPGDRVEVDYSLRRQNGYFIYSTVEGVSFQPRDVPTGVVELTMGGGAGGVGGAGGPGAAPAVIRGLEEALVGLRAGARVRVLVPPEVGYSDGGAGALGPLPPTFATRRQLLNHVREPLLFEVEVLKVKKGAK